MLTEQHCLRNSPFFLGASVFLLLLLNSSQPIQPPLLESRIPVTKGETGAVVSPGEEHASPLFTPLPQTPFLQQEHYCRQASSTVPLLISFLAKLPSPFSFSLFQSVQHCVCCSASPSTTSMADHRPRMAITISYIKLNNHTQAVRAPHCSIDKNSPCCW